MKYAVLCLALLFSLGLSAQNKKNSTTMYRHVVMFKFKPSSSKTAVDSIVNAFIALKTEIPVIKAFEWGLNVSPEHQDQGITHCFVVTFASTQDRDGVYQDHPAHVRFKKLVGPHVEKVVVVDFKVEN
jgi:hypothetical protein